MTGSSHDAIDRTVAKTREWIDELAAELGTEDRHEAAMTVLRRRVSTGEIKDVLANFPTDLRELFEASAQG